MAWLPPNPIPSQVGRVVMAQGLTAKSVELALFVEQIWLVVPTHLKKEAIWIITFW